MQDGKHVILCVDDDADVLECFKVVLEANGYAMVQASSADEALAVYKQSDPDLLIVDLMMEEIDAGVRFIEELKVLGNTAPIYMLSSIGDDLSTTVDYSSLGLAGVFQKPVDNSKLLEILQTVLQ